MEKLQVFWIIDENQNPNPGQQSLNNGRKICVIFLNDEIPVERKECSSVTSMLQFFPSFIKIKKFTVKLTKITS
jgi:hypothetical protein